MNVQGEVLAVTKVSNSRYSSVLLWFLNDPMFTYRGWRTRWTVVCVEEDMQLMIVIIAYLTQKNITMEV